MTSEHWRPNSHTADVLRRIVDLARKASEEPGGDDDTQAARDSQRVAKTTMEMAMRALEAPETQQDPVELMVVWKIAEEKERRKAERARERTRMEQELRERNEYWEAEVEKVRSSIEQRMTEERELECEWQEAKYEAKRKRDEAEQRSIEQTATDAVKRAQERLIKTQKETELLRREVFEVNQELNRQRERANQAESTLEEHLIKEEASRRLFEDLQETVAWARYENQWRLLRRISNVASSAKGVFHFEDLPWPTVVPPSSPSEITLQAFSKFLLSGPPLEEGMTLRSRIKDCLLKWHPDKFSGRWMQYVVENDRERVREGIDVVTRTGNQMLSECSGQKQLTN